jgi:hypothetical protein
MVSFPNVWKMTPWNEVDPVTLNVPASALPLAVVIVQFTSEGPAGNDVNRNET